MNGTGLSLPKRTHGKEQLSASADLNSLTNWRIKVVHQDRSPLGIQ
jgi:hypothetical protein